MRRIAALAPRDVPAGASDAEMSRQLAWDTIATLTRAEVVLVQATDAVIALTEEQRRANDIRAHELDLARRQVDLSEREAVRNADREAQWRHAAIKVGAGAAGWVGRIAFDQRMISALIGAVLTALSAALASWGIGVHLGP